MAPAGGDWGVAGNWSSDKLPGPQDDVVINALNPGAIVTHSQNVTDTIHSLTAAANGPAASATLITSPSRAI